MIKEEEKAIEIVAKYLNFNEICGTRNFKEALETVLSMLKEKDKEIEKKNVSYKKIWKLHQKGYSINKISKELDYDWQQVKIRINEIYDNPELLEKGE